MDDARTLKARIFIPDLQVQRIRSGDPVSLKLESLFQPIRGQVRSIAPASSVLAPGLVQEEKYKGIAPPSYYVATVVVSNASGMLQSGMSGDANIQVRRQSIVGFAWRPPRGSPAKGLVKVGANRNGGGIRRLVNPPHGP